MGELWIESYLADSCLYMWVILCVLTRTTRKLYKEDLLKERLLFNRKYISLFSELELYARYQRQVMNPNMQDNLLPIRNLCIHVVLTPVTRKLQDVYTALLSEISILCDIAGCEIRLVSYVSKHSWQSYLVSHSCVSTRIT